MARAFAINFYRTKAWQQARLEALKRDHFLCRKCGHPAKEVHHIIPLTAANINDPAIALGQDNLICLCFDCHQAEHGNRSDNACEFTPDGRPVPKK